MLGYSVNRTDLGHATIIARVSIDLVDDQREGHAIPLTVDAADRTATALLLIEEVPDVVALVRRATTDSGVEPGCRQQACGVTVGMHWCRTPLADGHRDRLRTRDRSLTQHDAIPQYRQEWSRVRDSNSRHPLYKSDALPTELTRPGPAR